MSSAVILDKDVQIKVSSKVFSCHVDWKDVFKSVFKGRILATLDFWWWFPSLFFLNRIICQVIFIWTVPILPPCCCVFDWKATLQWPHIHLLPVFWMRSPACNMAWCGFFYSSLLKATRVIINGYFCLIGIVPIKRGVAILHENYLLGWEHSLFIKWLNYRTVWAACRATVCVFHLLSNLLLCYFHKSWK